MFEEAYAEKILKVKNYSNKFITKIPFNTKIINVIKLMHERQVRNVFVEKDEKFIGIVTVKEIMRTIEKDPLIIFNEEIVNYAKNLEEISNEESIFKAAKIMYDKDIGILAVKENGKITAKVGERDLLLAIPHLDLKLRVMDMMTKDVEYVSPDNTILDSIVVMNKRKSRHVPVMENDKLIGMLSSRDILRLFSKCNNEENVKEAINIKVRKEMNISPLTIDLYAYIKDAANLMINKNIGALPVLDVTKVVGIITERDMIKTLALRF
ncbi:MAG: CBS domain-containing protein [Thermoproteota archaeon]|jgi:CBS domain-containing protein|nr:CBS domain-containing protein [Thermoproteota archaeon]